MFLFTSFASPWTPLICLNSLLEAGGMPGRIETRGKKEGPRNGGIGEEGGLAE
jgi:hypothetical protein